MTGSGWNQTKTEQGEANGFKILWVSIEGARPEP